MRQGHLLYLCVITVVISLFSSCQHRKKHQDYAQRAYSEQQAERSERLLAPSQDETDNSDLVLELQPPIEKKEWQRRPYETVDSWLERLRHYLLANEDLINDLCRQKEGVDQEQQKHGGKMKALIDRNEQLRAEINYSEVPIIAQTTTFESSPAPFSIHVVRRGETLFSIAMENYGSGESVRDMMLWNQGWIRQPDELVAGVGIVLFPEGSQDTNNAVVDQYLDQVSTSPIQTSVE